MLHCLVWCRRAVCHLQTLRYQKAVADFKKLLALEPHNETVRGQMLATQKLIKKIEFEKVSLCLISIGKPPTVVRLLNGKGRRTQWIDAEKLLLKVCRPRIFLGLC